MWLTPLTNVFTGTAIRKTFNCKEFLSMAIPPFHVHTWNPPGNPIALFISHKTKESGSNLISIEIEPYVWGLFSLWYDSKVSFDRFFKNTRKRHLIPSHRLSLFYWLGVHTSAPFMCSIVLSVSYFYHNSGSWFWILDLWKATLFHSAVWFVKGNLFVFHIIYEGRRKNRIQYEKTNFKTDQKLYCLLK